MGVIEIGEKEFADRVKTGRVLVDCYADWCGPCRMLSPIIDELSKEIEDYHFYKLNIDDAEEIAKRYGIMSIPTILIFEDGELKKTVIGFHSKDEMKEMFTTS